MATVAAEAEATREVLSRVEQLEDIAGTLPAGDERRSQLFAIARDELATVASVRPRIAANILGLNEKTIRAWTDEGILTTVAQEPRVLLDTHRVHEVWHLLRDLREAGKTRGLLDEVYRRLTDNALLTRDDLQDSLTQLRHGEGTLVAKAPTR